MKDKYLRKSPPQLTDVSVGRRVRMRRMMLGMSQSTLGDEVGVTFQQVQKYEKGANRIGAGRLQQIAQVLQVPVSFFFEEPPVPRADGDVLSDLQSLFATRDGLDLARAFQKISDPRLRRRVVALVEQLTGDSDGDSAS